MISIKMDKLNTLIEKAKKKKNGVFSSSPFKYVVRDGSITFIGERHTGAISQIAFGFLCSVGKVEPYELDKELKALTKRLPM